MTKKNTNAIIYIILKKMFKKNNGTTSIDNCQGKLFYIPPFICSGGYSLLCLLRETIYPPRFSLVENSAQGRKEAYTIKYPDFF